METMRVAVLMSVYNRKTKTLSCLSACYSQIEQMKADRKYDFTVYMTEDGCTDGTSEAVSEMFPDVRIIHGDGHLYWNRGMCAAWEEAAREDYDFYLWLNDDTIINEGALQCLLEISGALGNKAIIAGTAEASDGSISYGGRTKKGKIIVPDSIIPVGCDIFNGNLVLVPRHVFRRLGTMDPVYSHSFGDYDYGVRAERAGVDSVVAPGILASCDRNPGIPVWRDGAYSLKQRYASVTGPKGRPFREQFIYDVRSEGWLMAIMHFVTLNLRVIFPARKSGSGKSKWSIPSHKGHSIFKPHLTEVPGEISSQNCTRVNQKSSSPD